MSAVKTGAGDMTEGQLVAVSAAGAVFVFLVIANLTVCRLYRRAATQGARTDTKQRRTKSDLWVYQVHRTTPMTATAESASEQILRTLRASHDNLQATIEAKEQTSSRNTLGHDECQALEELEVTADLFLHDTSLGSSRRSSLRSHHSNDLNFSFTADLDFSADPDLSDFRDLDKVSVSSVTMADFENDPDELGGVGGKGSWNKRRRSVRRERGVNPSQTIPVAEFHNEAFDFAQETTAAVERVKDVEL